MYTFLRILLGAAAAAGTSFAGPDVGLSIRGATAPPAPPPPIEAAPTAGFVEPSLRAAATLYSIGDPNPEEQLYIEMVNRARAYPAAEGQIFANTTDPETLNNYDYFDVNLSLMQAQFALIPPVPPVAPNAQLASAARRHSADMLANSFQGHVGSDKSTVLQRIQATGYNFSTIGENVYSHVESVFHGHAGFEVDWGGSIATGGMQSPPGHRITIHSANYREIGVGVVFGRNQPASGSQIPGSDNVGPQLVTQEFGSRQGATPLITGVVYFDLNGNSFYDLGEGVGGVSVRVSGTATEAVSARSGGYAVPVAGNGSYTVTFSANGLPSVTRQVTISQTQNQKVDLLPTYTPPFISGSASPAINNANSYSISPVPAANAYQWRSRLLATPSLEGAENGSAGVTIIKTGSYNVFETAAKKSGSYAFHLVHPSTGVSEQSILLNPRYLISANSSLRFESRLGLASTAQFAIVQVSVDNGATWQEVYRQAGTGSNGETSFQARTISLSQFAGSVVTLRFSYLPQPGSYFPQTDANAGWLIDDIAVRDAFQISVEQVNEVPNPSFVFQPTALADYTLEARARSGHDYLPWGPMLSVRSAQGSTAPRELRINSLSVVNGQVQIEVDLLSGSIPTAWTVQSKGSVEQLWRTAAASVTAISPTRFRFHLQTAGGSSRQLYRVHAN